MSSASLCMSPSVEERTAVADAPVTSPVTPLPNGHDRVDATRNCDAVNGNVHVNIVSESTTSMDVLSGGESDAGDTLNRRNNNSISSTLTGTLCVRDKDGDGVRRRGRDITYSIADELLMTERTYKRDLELVTVSWCGQVSSLGGCGADVVSALGRACLALEPLAIPTGALLAKLDKCLTAPLDTDNEPEYKKIGELLYDYLSSTFDAYSTYTDAGCACVGVLESVRRRSAAADAAAASFESHAPLPLACLLLRPMHRLLHIERLAIELCEATGTPASQKAADLARELARAASSQLRHVENHALLCQLQRDIIGYDKLLVAGREFIRLGCVYKHSSKGMQQRMLFLFSDLLVVTSRAGSSQFRAHAAIPLRHVRVAHADLPHTFTLTWDPEGNSSMVISVSNEHEFGGWVHALQNAAKAAADADTDTEVDTELTAHGQDAVVSSGPSSVAGGGALTQVCWHRAASLSRDHLHLAMRTQLSGCLLRKFKNSIGWQKLWVVFAAFTLFFYKSWRDEQPLASLPLLGYSVGAPSETDAIQKDYVFKLQYKNHVYFFRANSHFTYCRWTEVLQTAMVRNQLN